MGPFHAFHPQASIPSAIWQQALHERFSVNTQVVPTPPEEVSLLVQARQEARRTNNWNLADDLRQQIYNLGWEITDTETGPLTNKLS